MADIVRRDPFIGMRQMMDRLFDDSFFRPLHDTGFDEGTLPVDIYESDGTLKVRASLPGFDKDDIDVQVHEGVLSINAKHVEESETKDEHYYRKERRVGSVSRRIALPGVVHDAEVEAELTNGVLTLSLPLPEKAQPKQIEIRGS
jgi:HSP20 family protein